MNPQSPQELMSSCQGLVRSIAWKIHQKVVKNVELDDLIGYGQVGLAEAARDFDQSRGNQFTTYAYYRIRGAILDGLSTMSWFRKADYHRGRYEAAANDILENTSDRDSDDLQWFARTARALSGSFVMSELAQNAANDSESPASAAQPSDSLSLAETQEMIRSLISGLAAQEQALIRRIYFDGWSIKRAGEEIGVSKAWASRLHARTLERLALQLTGYV